MNDSSRPQMSQRLEFKVFLCQSLSMYVLIHVFLCYKDTFASVKFVYTGERGARFKWNVNDNVFPVRKA